MKMPGLIHALFRKKTTTTFHFIVGGMNCGSCAERVEKAVRQLPGIASLKVDLAGGSVVVEHDRSQATPEQIQQQISAAGYSAKTATQ